MGSRRRAGAGAGAGAARRPRARWRCRCTRAAAWAVNKSSKRSVVLRAARAATMRPTDAAARMMRRSTTLTTGWSCLEPVRNVLLLVRPSDSLPSVTRERRRSGRASAIRSSHSRSLRKSSNTNISGDSLRSCADARGGPRGDSAGEGDREGLRRREARCAAGGSRRGGTLFFFSAEVSPTSRDASPLRPPSASSPSASSYPESSYPESSPPSRARGGSFAAASATKRSATSSWNERQTSASPTSASRDAKPFAPHAREARSSRGSSFWKSSSSVASPPTSRDTASLPRKKVSQGGSTNLCAMSLSIRRRKVSARGSARKTHRRVPHAPRRVAVVVRLFRVPTKRRGRVRGRVARDADSASRGPPERLAEGRDHLHHRAGEVQAGNLRRRRFVGDGDFFFVLIQGRFWMRNVVARRLAVFAGRVRSVLLRVRPGEQREAETRVHLVGPAGLASHRGAFGTGAGEPRRGSPLGVARETPPFAAAALEVQGVRLGVAVAGAVPEEPPLHVGAQLRAARVARAREPRRVSARARGEVRGRGAAPHHGGVVPVPDVHVPSRLRDRGLARGRPRRVSARAPVGQTPRGRSRASVVRGDLQGRARATVRAVQGLAARASRGPPSPRPRRARGPAGAAAHGRGRLA